MRILRGRSTAPDANAKSICEKKTVRHLFILQDLSLHLKALEH